MVFICDQFNETEVFVMSNETCFEQNCTKIQWYIKLSFLFLCITEQNTSPKTEIKYTHPWAQTKDLTING